VHTDTQLARPYAMRAYAGDATCPLRNAQILCTIIWCASDTSDRLADLQSEDRSERRWTGKASPGRYAQSGKLLLHLVNAVTRRYPAAQPAVPCPNLKN